MYDRRRLQAKIQTQAQAQTAGKGRGHWRLAKHISIVKDKMNSENVSTEKARQNGRKETGALAIKKIKIDSGDRKAVDAAFEGLQAHPVSVCNWPEVAPYTPEVRFKLFHTGKDFVIRYNVTEESTRAEAAEDGGMVWQDSCVECFISPDSDDRYYNIEANCIGTVLLNHRRKGDKAERAGEDVYKGIRRFPSLKAEAFPLRVEERHWELTLIIPATSLFKDSLECWDGIKCSMNFYKCGDKLQRIHFLSWAPVGLEKPQFHAPEFFQPVEFE